MKQIQIEYSPEEAAAFWETYAKSTNVYFKLFDTDELSGIEARYTRFLRKAKRTTQKDGSILLENVFKEGDSFLVQPDEMFIYETRTLTGWVLKVSDKVKFNQDHCTGSWYISKQETEN